MQKKTEKHSVSDGSVMKRRRDTKTLDIYVYRTNEEKIEIKFDLLSYEKNEEYLPLGLQEPYINYDERDEQYRQDESSRILEEILYYCDSTDSMFNASEVIFSEIKDSDLISYISSSITYQVSTFPHIVLNWLGYFSKYLNIYLWQLDGVHLKNNIDMVPFTICDSQNNNIVSMQEYIKHENYVKGGVQLKLLESILLLKQNDHHLAENNDPYLDVLNALQYMTEAYNSGRSQSITFLQCVNLKIRCTILFDEYTKKIFDRKINEVQRLNVSLSIAGEFISKNQKTELNFFINCLNYRARKILFEQCLGTKANDTHAYSWLHTEWYFLQYAEFSLKNNRISIINLGKNPGYQRYYAAGKINHHLMRLEMEHLAKILDLEFEPDCNFHSELTFTEVSTMKLQRMGFGISGLMNECKKLLYKNNFCSFFSRSKVDKENKETNILDLSMDILSVVQEKMELYRTLP